MCWAINGPQHLRTETSRAYGSLTDKTKGEIDDGERTEKSSSSKLNDTLLNNTGYVGSLKGNKTLVKRNESTT